MGAARYNDAERAILEHVGKEIRRLRRLKGWSQADLGQRVGENFQTVQKWECAANAISVPQLCAVSAALGVSPARLVPIEYAPERDKR